jgi:hypothetical protein
MTEDDKDKPPPLIHTVTAPSAEPPETDAEAEARADRELYLWEAEQLSKALPAAFVNRAFVKAEGRVVRISFGERVGDEDIYRSAIVMTPEDAYELGQLLMSQAAPAYGGLIEHYRQIWEGLEDDEGPVDG